ncbi:MAG: peptidoglycan DD-metalloendopeptidase family protein [Bdellovibrionota bacterium]
MKGFNRKLIGIFVGLIALLQMVLIAPLLVTSTGDEGTPIEQVAIATVPSHSDSLSSGDSPNGNATGRVAAVRAAYMNWDELPLDQEATTDPLNDTHQQEAQLLDAPPTAPRGTPPELDVNPFSVETPNKAPNAQEPRIYTVRSGDTLSRIWNKHGSEAALANQAAAAFRKAGISLSSLRAGEDLVLSVSSTGEISKLKKELNDGKVLLLELNDNAYDSRIVEPEIITTRRIASGTIDHSLAASSLAVGIPYEVIDEFIDLFSGRVEFSRDTQPGDSFTVIYEERQIKGGKSLAPGVIHAASFMNRGELLVAVRHVDSNDEARYYNRKGEAIGNHFLRYPVKFTRISSLFNKGRFHPVLKKRRPHHGVDFAAPTGTPVRTVADGVVEKAGYYGGNGIMVKIKHGSKYASAYVHLSKISKGIRAGARVKRGQVIGAVGSTGLATGPHLHYAFYVNGKYVDPMKINLPQLPNSHEPIPAEFLQAMLSELEHQHQQVQIAYAARAEQTVSGGV